MYGNNICHQVPMNMRQQRLRITEHFYTVLFVQLYLFYVYIANYLLYILKNILFYIIIDTYIIKT